MNKTLLLLVGESGSGKTTVADTLSDKFGLKVLKSYTTRPKRYENETGHEFVSEEEFKNIRPRDTAAYTKIGEYEYCATNRQIAESDIYVIDLAGIRYLKNNYKGNKKIKVVYIKTKQDLRKQRMEARGDKQSDISFRMRNDSVTFDGAERASDFVVENNENIDETVLRIWRYYIGA